MVVKRDHRLQLILELSRNLRGSLGEVRVHALARQSSQRNCRDGGGRDREECKYPYQLCAQGQIAESPGDIHGRAAVGSVAVASRRHPAGKVSAVHGTESRRASEGIFMAVLGVRIGCVAASSCRSALAYCPNAYTIGGNR